MTSHNKTSKQQRWLSVKVEIIRRFGTIRAAAAALACHPNSVRLAAEGRCPRVRARIEKHIPKEAFCE